MYKTAYQTLLSQHLPINLSSSSRPPQQSSPPLQSQPPQPVRTHNDTRDTRAGIRTSTKRKAHHDTNKYFLQPILIINLPVYNHNIKWKQITMVPENLRNTLNFQLAYKFHDIIISKCSPRTLGSMYISSKF